MPVSQHTASKPAAAKVYLHLMPHRDDTRPGRWFVFQVSEASPRITVAATVTSWEDARTLAARTKRPLHIAELAWLQMNSAGVAADDLPDDVTIV